MQVVRLAIVVFAFASAGCAQNEQSFRPEVVKGSDGCPRWSDDGAWIAFDRLHRTSEDDVQKEVYVVDPSGRAPRRLTRTEAWESVLGWRSPAGEVVFDRGHGSGDFEDWRWDGVHGIAPTGQAEARRIGPAPGNANWWELSPDGRRLAVGVESPDGLHLDVSVVPVGGARGVALPRAYVAAPTWAPDGTRLAYYENKRTIIVVGSDGRVLGRVHARFPAGHFAWSPNGTRVAYLADDNPSHFAHGSRGDVMVARSDGQRGHRVSESDGDWLAWSADGSSVLYARGGELRAVDADGSHDRRLVQTGGDSLDCLAVSPKGDRIAFLRVVVTGGGVIPPTDDVLVTASPDGGDMLVVPPN